MLHSQIEEICHYPIKIFMSLFTSATRKMSRFYSSMPMVTTGLRVLMVRPVGFAMAFCLCSTAVWADRYSDCNQDSEIHGEIADFTKLIALNHEDVWAIFFRGMAYEAKGEFDSAIADYDKLVALKPNNANMYIVRGLAYADWGEDDRAIADFRRALAINPSNQGAINNLKALGVTP